MTYDANNEATKLSKSAYSLMKRGRTGFLRGKTRAIGRMWSWGDKKKAARIGAGIAIGVAAIAVTAATAGAATPAAIALAVAGYAVATGASIASNRVNLRDRPKNIGRIEKLKDKMDVVKADATTVAEYRDRKSEVKYLRNHAHRCIKRCFVHWRKTLKKVHGLHQAQNNDLDSCDDVAELLKDKMYFVHHLDKSRLYLMPAIMVLQSFYDLYAALRKQQTDTRLLENITLRLNQRPCDGASRSATGR